MAVETWRHSRAIDRAVLDLRRDISEAATKLADQHGEP
jgi:hypothetical protein